MTFWLFLLRGISYPRLLTLPMRTFRRLRLRFLLLWPGPTSFYAMGIATIIFSPNPTVFALPCCPLCYSLPCRNHAPPTQDTFSNTLRWRRGDSNPRPRLISRCIFPYGLYSNNTVYIYSWLLSTYSVPINFSKTLLIICQ